MEIVGRLVALDNGKAKFSGALRNVCTLADLKMGRLLDTIDAWVAAGRDIHTGEPARRFEPTKELPPGATVDRLGVPLLLTAVMLYTPDQAPSSYSGL